MRECQQLFKNEIWNCSLENKNVYQQLPIFVKTTLPYGKLDFSFFWSYEATEFFIEGYLGYILARFVLDYT